VKLSHYFTMFSLVLLVSSLYAQGAVKFSGQIRQRFESVDNTFEADESANNFNAMRSRFNAKFAPAENVSAFFQLQDYRTFGTENGTVDGSASNIDLHQVNVTISKLFDQPLDLKIGRMEYNMGPQRLIGAIGWSNIAQSFDGFVFTYQLNDIAVTAFNFKETEKSAPEDKQDKSIMGLETTLAISDALKINPFVVRQNTVDTFSRITAGADINGKAAGFGYEIELAYQFGGRDNNDADDYDIAANMIALNVNYQVGGIGLSAGIDILSGDDVGTDDKNETFNTLYATNHKYYGFMDFFPRLAFDAGLRDLHVKAMLKPIDKTTLAVAAHSFSAAGEATLDDGTKASAYANEVDVTAKYAYSKQVGFQAGFSFAAPGDIFKHGFGKESATWFYLMTVVNF